MESRGILIQAETQSHCKFKDMRLTLILLILSIPAEHCPDQQAKRLHTPSLGPDTLKKKKRSIT